ILDTLDLLLGERARITGRMRAIYSQFCKCYPAQLAQLKDGIRHCAKAISLPLASAVPDTVDRLVANARLQVSGFLGSALCASRMSPAALRVYRDSARSGNAPASIRAPDDGSFSMNASDDQIRMNVSNAPRPAYSSRDELTDRNIWDANKY
ncbi:MAG: hypothetical protein V1728_03005, partial [Candidatus Micrarchaeota archaeon]